MQKTEHRENMTASMAVQITRNLLGDINLPVKCEEATNIIRAAMKNLDVIVKMIEKEQNALKEEHHENDPDEQGENVPG